MFDKKAARLRRAKKTRAHIRQLGVNRLTVTRTPRHIYAQVISPTGGVVVAQASTLDASLRSGVTGNVEAAKAVGDAKGLSVVMTKDTVLYGGVDITDQVLKKLATDAKK